MLESTLEKWGIIVIHKRRMHEKLAIIDNSILWIGSLNILSFWKGVTITIILFFGLVFVYNPFNRTGTSETDKSSYNQQVDTYYEYLENQDKRNLEYYKKADAQIFI